MKKTIITIFITLVAATSCSNQPKTTNTSSEAPKKEAAEKTDSTDAGNTVSIDGISQFVSWDLGILTVTKEGEGYLLADKTGNLKLHLSQQTDGTYQETSGKHDMIGQGAHFSLSRVDSVITLTATYDGRIQFTMVTGNDLKTYRDRGYKRMLTSKFEPIDGRTVTFTDERVKGIDLPDCPEMNYFFIEGDDGDLTDKIRLSPGRFHIALSPADKGVNLHFCNLNPTTGELTPNYDEENTDHLRYAADPGWEWLSTDVLDSGFLIYNFDKPNWELMLRKLNTKQKPNEVEQWNKQLINYLITSGEEPYSALESTDI